MRAGCQCMGYGEAQQKHIHHRPVAWQQPPVYEPNSHRVLSRPGQTMNSHISINTIAAFNAEEAISIFTRRACGASKPYVDGCGVHLTALKQSFRAVYTTRRGGCSQKGEHSRITSGRAPTSSIKEVDPRDLLVTVLLKNTGDQTASI